MLSLRPAMCGGRSQKVRERSSGGSAQAIHCLHALCVVWANLLDSALYGSARTTRWLPFYALAADASWVLPKQHAKHTCDVILGCICNTVTRVLQAAVCGVTTASTRDVFSGRMSMENPRPSACASRRWAGPTCAKCTQAANPMPPRAEFSQSPAQPQVTKWQGLCACRTNWLVT